MLLQPETRMPLLVETLTLLLQEISLRPNSSHSNSSFWDSLNNSFSLSSHRDSLSSLRDSLSSLRDSLSSKFSNLDQSDQLLKDSPQEWNQMVFWILYHDLFFKSLYQNFCESNILLTVILVYKTDISFSKMLRFHVEQEVLPSLSIPFQQLVHQHLLLDQP